MPATPPEPVPETIDCHVLASQLREELQLDVAKVESLWLIGSFAKPTKRIDRSTADRSDIDVLLVLESATGYDDAYEYDGRYPASITVQTVFGTSYGERTVDLIVGCTRPRAADHCIRLDTAFDTHT